MSRARIEEIRCLLAEETVPRSRIRKIKSNDRMPPRTKAYITQMEDQVRAWKSPHRTEALRFMEKMTPAGLFDLLHSMRRWYTGQTMARRILASRGHLKAAMKLSPSDAVGVYRGFKVPIDDPLASVKVGDRLSLSVTRNHGFSSWSTTEEPTNRFSGGGKGKVGLIVKLVSGQGITPVLSPPEQTKPWFNELYAEIIGNSFRPKEGEYLISGSEVRVEVVRVKK